MITIAPDQAHLWYVFEDRVDDADLIMRYHGLMNGQERARHERFLFAHHRHQYLVTRALCRTTLSRYADVEPSRWEFGSNKHGRPEIVGPSGVPPLRFNLSNSGGLIVCLITRVIDAGVDVEDLRRRAETLRIADRYFSPAEVAALRTLPADRQHRRFFEYWTLKESYIKARGMGLALPLDQFTFHLDAGEPITISFGPKIEDDPRAWQFERRTVGERHLMAIALRRGSGPPLRIDVRETVPLR